MMKYFYLSLVAFLQASLLLGHGFGANTLVMLADNTWQQMSTLCYRALKKKVTVASYDTASSFQTAAQVVRGGRSQVNCYISFGFEEQQHRHDVSCTPTQEFYNTATHQWVPAYMLKIGDKLLCAHNVTKTVASISLIKEPLPICTLEVKRTHSFFVTRHSILTHNMVIPLAFSIGLSVPFGAAAGGAAGGFFGPITFVAGAAIGCVVGALVKFVCNSKIPTYSVEAYNVNDFEQHVRQQPQVAIFSESQVVLSPDYVATQHSMQYESLCTGDRHIHYDESNQPLFSTTIVNLPKEKPGCGDTTPQKPLILITPAEPMPVLQNPGYRPLSDEERKLLSGCCTIIPLPAQKKEDFIMTVTAKDAQKRWAESDKMRDLGKRIKELEKTVSNARPGNWSKTHKPFPALIKDYEWAETTYEKIRVSNDDVNKIATNLGVPKSVIQAIKNHLFITQHKRNGKVAAFEPDYDIAKAWERLVAGTFLKADLVLLEHELAESLLMGEEEMTYEEAHNIVEKFVSWEQEL
jgi:hypothetical protein